MIPDLFGPVCEVVGIDPDAMTADKAGREREEVPFRPGRFEYVVRVDIKPMENGRQLVHKRDIEVALGILDDFGGFGGPDVWRAVNPGRYDRAVHIGDHAERFIIRPGDNLRDRFERMRLVARIDTLWRVADGKVCSIPQARDLLQNGHALVFG